MFRPAFRATIGTPTSLRAVPRSNAARRFLSTAPPHQKSRSWKSSAVRWGLAGALVYYYNTSSVFAEEPPYIHAPPETSRESETYPTVASVAEQRRSQSRQSLAAQQQQQPQTSSKSVAVAPNEDAPEPGSPEALEEEAGQEGAFNEETGEINWDCPCLGGMAHGPCGEQFREAFSCFVFSKEEPKGIDCIENFKAMQNCFREHPDVYGAELEDDEEGAEQAGEQPVEAQTAAAGGSEQSDVQARSAAAAQQVKRDYAASGETDEAVPKAWHDSRATTDK